MVLLLLVPRVHTCLLEYCLGDALAVVGIFYKFTRSKMSGVIFFDEATLSTDVWSETSSSSSSSGLMIRRPADFSIMLASVAGSVKDQSVEDLLTCQF